MNDFFFQPLSEYEPYPKMKQGAAEHRLIAAFGMSEEQKTHLAAALCRDTGRPVLYVENSEAAAVRSYENLTQLLGEGVYLLPVRELSLFYVSSSSREQTNRRIETLYAAARGKARAVVASAQALQHPLMSVSGFLSHAMTIRTGDVLTPAGMAEHLVRAGYERVSRVEAGGQFWLRGGLLDVCVCGSTQGIRIEWFDDEVDSIRSFDTQTQRSIENLPEAEIPPARELLCESEDWAAEAAGRLENALRRTLSKGRAGTEKQTGQDEADLPDGDLFEGISPGSARERLENRIGEDLAILRGGTCFPNMEAYANLLWPQSEGISGWLEDPLTLISEPDRVRDAMEGQRDSLLEDYKAAFESGEALLGQEELLRGEAEVLPELTRQGAVLLSDFLRTTAGLRPQELVRFEGVGATAYQGKLKDLAADLKGWRKEGWRVALLAGGEARGERLRETLTEMEASVRTAAPEDGAGIRPGDAVIYPLSLSHGFLYPAIRFAVIADSDLYGAIYRRRSRRNTAGDRLSAFTELKEGDYVVHENHGVGIYRGVIRLQSEGKWRDYLHIQYAGADKLYVPVDQMDRIRKFIGGEEAAPKLNRLGGSDWQRQKQKVRSSIRTIAFDLVKLYAARREAVGFAFSADTVWQRQFEDNFPYEETPDQLQAIEEIKRDMEAPHVMDRLLCGDVGYGKTEVALRAVFKAVMDGKQAAILEL